MQALVTQGLVINRKHQDAAGCVFAMPVMERGGEVVRDVSWRGSKGLGQPVWTGTRNYANMRGGRGLSTTGANTVATPLTGQPWAGQFSVMYRVNYSARSDGFFGCGGFVLGVVNASGLMRLWNSAGTIIATTVRLTINTGVEYAVGCRWRSSDNLVSFFLNGEQEDIAGAAVAAANVSTQVAVQAPFTAGTSVSRDFRVWNRYMPAGAFGRYYVNPNAFYTPARSPLRGVSANIFGQMFFPFLHPALQS